MNREIAIPGGAGVYPLTGDVTSTAGSSTVAVTGIQNVPVSANIPQAGENLQYNVNTNSWTPTLRASVQVNGVTVSDDSSISVNLDRPITVNGV